MSLALVRADAIAVTTAMTISQATLSGTWRDNWGNSGALTFSPVAPVSGMPRPVTLRGDWAISFRSAAAQESSSQSLSFAQTLSSGPSTIEIVPTGGGPTTACPGTATNPQALPGVLCLYQTLRQNVAGIFVFNAQTGVVSTANAFGASIFVTASTAQSIVISYGAWALGVR